MIISMDHSYIIFLVDIFQSCCKKFLLYSHYISCLGVLYRDVGSITLSIEAYERCLQIDPDSRNAGQVTCFFGFVALHILIIYIFIFQDVNSLLVS